MLSTCEGRRDAIDYRQNDAIDPTETSGPDSSLQGWLGAISHSRPIFKVLDFSRLMRRVPGVRHETAAVYHASRGRGGDMAARGPSSAEGDAGDRISQHRLARHE